VVETTTYLSNALFLAVAIYVAWSTISSPRGSNYLVLAFFALLSLIIAFTWVSRLVEFISGSIAEYLPVMLVLFLPYILLQLARAYSSVNWKILRVCEGALALALVLVFIPGSTYFPVLSILIFYFVGISGYAAYRFHAGSIDANGITRMRLRALSNATILLGIALFTVGITTLIGGFVGTSIEVGRQFLLMGSALLFLVGFSPPILFRRAWQEPELRRFLHRTQQLSRWSSDADVYRFIEKTTAETIGAPYANLGLWDEETGLVEFSLVSVKPGETIAGRAFAENRAILSLDTLRDDPDSADMYQQGEAFAVMAAPISTDEGTIGVIVVYSPNPPIFADDDLSLLTLLADQIGVLLENRKHLRAQAELAAREESTRLKDEFLSVAAHDLKTPLTTILATGQYLERRLARNDGTESELRSARRLNREAIRLRSLVQGLLDASRIEQGQFITHQEPARVDALVNEVIERARTYDTHKFETDLAPGIVASCDAVRIQQVIENLIENAQKYSPGGSTIDVHLWQDAEHVYFEVSDQGLGIAVDDQHRIFDRYFRTPESENSSAQGIGLGLYICKAIIEQHNGSIEVSSSPGSGSTFRFSIPRITEGDSAQDDPAGIENQHLLREHSS
jgi:signal transduction histidine kinase